MSLKSQMILHGSVTSENLLVWFGLGSNSIKDDLTEQRILGNVSKYPYLKAASDSSEERIFKLENKIKELNRNCEGSQTDGAETSS